MFRVLSPKKFKPLLAAAVAVTTKQDDKLSSRLSLPKVQPIVTLPTTTTEKYYPKHLHITRRFFALVIDVFVTMIGVWSLFGYVLSPILKMKPIAILHRILSPLLLPLVLSLRNYNGTSLGQYYTGLKLHTDDGHDMDPLESIVRHVVFLGPLLVNVMIETLSTFNKSLNSGSEDTTLNNLFEFAVIGMGLLNFGLQSADTIYTLIYGRDIGDELLGTYVDYANNDEKK